MLVVLLAFYASKNSYAQAVYNPGASFHYWNTADTVLNHELVETSPGNYVMHSWLKTPPPPGVTYTIYVSFYARPIDYNYSDDRYFTYWNNYGEDNSEAIGSIDDFDWCKWSEIIFEWSVFYSDGTYDDYAAQYDVPTP